MRYPVRTRTRRTDRCYCGNLLVLDYPRRSRCRRCTGYYGGLRLGGGWYLRCRFPSGTFHREVDSASWEEG